MSDTITLPAIVAYRESMGDLWLGGTGVDFLTVRLSKYARTRYDAALWYAWGRDDAGDATLRELPSWHYLGDAFGFAGFAALEAEAYHREQVCSLSCIADQYARYVAALREAGEQ